MGSRPFQILAWNFNKKIASRGFLAIISLVKIKIWRTNVRQNSFSREDGLILQARKVSASAI